MFAEPVGVPGWAIAGGGEEPVVERKDDRVEPGPLDLRRQRSAILAPDIVVKPLLLVVVVASDDRFLRGHRIHIVGRERTKRGEQCGRFWGKARGDGPHVRKWPVHAPMTGCSLLAHGATL